MGIQVVIKKNEIGISLMVQWLGLCRDPCVLTWEDGGGSYILWDKDGYKLTCAV